MSVNDIAAALWQAAHVHGHAGLELEFRLGHSLPGGHFSPNVGKEQFLRLMAKLDASKAFGTVTDIETIDRIGTAKHVTTTHVAIDGVVSDVPPPYCMTKSKVFQLDSTLDECPYTIRTSLAIEKIVPDHDVVARYTRRKTRRRYALANWAFDLTRVVSNVDIDAEETYEVEIELTDPGLLFEKTMDHIARWGLDLVRDAVRMLA
jgi:hypothetical protein